MPKIKMDKVRVEEVWIEVPEKCPNCGVDFMKPDEDDENPLKEQRWVGYGQDCYFEPMSDSGDKEFLRAEMGEVTENIYEMDLVFCYMCRKCDYVLADTTVEGESSEKATEASGRDPSS